MVEHNDIAPAAIDFGKRLYETRELRPVTLLFCDIVDSTVLARQLDVEDFQDLVTQFRAICSEVIDGAGGRVAQTAGDSVLGSFGDLATREDDAERAVRAALDLVQTLRTAKVGPNLRVQVRVGIATGVVAIDDRHDSIDGEAAHLAARLTKWAEPGSILTESRTHELSDALFDYTDLGSEHLKGFEAPLRLWRVERVRPSRTIFEAKARFGLTPFVNRERELSTLLSHWEDVCAGKGWVILLSGEPGIGKSRIASELQHRVSLSEEQVLRLQCRPDHQHTALHPIVDQLQRTLGLTRDDPMTVALSKIVTFVEGWSKDVSRIAQLYALLLSIPESHLGRLESNPDKLRVQTEAALIEFVIDRSSHAPVLLVVEDLHWADPTTISLLDALVEQTPAHPIMVLSTFRDTEFVPPWPPGARLTHLKLEQLEGPHRSILVRSVAANHSLSAAQHEIITTRSGGIPLFLEELTKSVVESGDESVMPGRIEALLHTRLDRFGAMATEGLGPVRTVKELAQLAAVIGWEFSVELLEEVLATAPGRRLDPAARMQLDAALKRLVDSELIRQQGEAFQFKHALVQEEAYLSMAKKKRDQLHARIAALLKDPNSRYRPAPELAASHCHEAGLYDDAIGYWREAGRRSARRSSNQEAEHHFRRAIATSIAMPDRLQTLSDRLGIYNELGPVLMASKGFAAPAVVEVYKEAVKLGARIGRPADQYFPALAGLQLVRIVQGRHREARQMGEECLAIANETGDTAHQIEAYRHRGATLFWSGEIAKSRADFEKLLDIYDADRHAELKFVFGTDPKVSALVFLSMAASLFGEFRDATAKGREAMNHVRAIAHRHSDSFANLMMALSLDMQGEQHEANERSLASINAGTEIPFWGSWAKIISGRILLANSPKAGLTRIEEGISDYRRTGAGLAETYFMVVLAQALAANDRLDEALERLEEGLALTERGGERFYESELLRWKGELLVAKRVAREEAEACFQTALAVAGKQGAKLFELRAASSLCRLASRPEARHDGLTRLASILARIDGAAKTPDVIDAEKLLATW